jgi:hypothetical protein
MQKMLPIPRSQIILIASIFGAYPKMILRRATLPPFIHPFSSVQLKATGNNSFPEPLEICISIAHMFVTRTDESSKFLYRTINTERDRLTKEVLYHYVLPL